MGQQNASKTMGFNSSSSLNYSSSASGFNVPIEKSLDPNTLTDGLAAAYLSQIKRYTNAYLSGNSASMYRLFMPANSDYSFETSFYDEDFLKIILTNISSCIDVLMYNPTFSDVETKGRVLAEMIKMTYAVQILSVYSHKSEMYGTDTLAVEALEVVSSTRNTIESIGFDIPLTSKELEATVEMVNSDISVVLERDKSYRWAYDFLFRRIWLFDVIENSTNNDDIIKSLERATYIFDGKIFNMKNQKILPEDNIQEFENDIKSRVAKSREEIDMYFTYLEYVNYIFDSNWPLYVKDLDREDIKEQFKGIRDLVMKALIFEADVAKDNEIDQSLYSIEVQKEKASSINRQMHHCLSLI